MRLVVVIAAIAAAVVSSAPIAASEPTVGPDQLTGVQPRPDEVAPLIRWPIDPPPPLEIQGTWRTPFNEGENISDPTCIGAVAPAGINAYRGSGYVAIDIQQLGAFDQHNAYLVVSAASSFPSPKSARDFLKKQTQIWTGCHEHRVSYQPEGNDETWEIRMPTTTDNSVAVVNYRTAGIDGASCSHALAVKSNVVAEVNACRTNIGLIEQGLTIANNMLAKAPG